MKRRTFLLSTPAFLSACALRRGAPLPGSLQDIDALSRAMVAMNGTVDISEARRAATLAYRETYDLALTYKIVDRPLIHNAKVNAGAKPRGLCWHWAEDLQNRLNAANFSSLEMHRAIANADNPIRIDHSTAIISAAGAPWHSGIVLDPWRYGGELFWAPVSEDKSYAWDEREAVMRRHGRVRYLKQGASG
jgi:hypothetical protein